MASTCGWARTPEILSWLTSVMQAPHETPAAAPMLPEGGITLGHIFELFELATDARAVNEMEGSSTSTGVLLETWLHHLGVLVLPGPPTGKETTTSRARYSRLKRALKEHRRQWKVALTRRAKIQVRPPPLTAATPPHPHLPASTTLLTHRIRVCARSGRGAPTLTSRRG